MVATARKHRLTGAWSIFPRELGETQLNVILRLGVLVPVPLLVAGTAFTGEEGRDPVAEHVRAANHRFNDGARDVHDVNANLIGDGVDIDHAQAGMFGPKP